MYEKLIKQLRGISNSDSNIKSNYIGLTMMQAADAIESLSKELMDLKLLTCSCCEVQEENGI